MRYAQCNSSKIVRFRFLFFTHRMEDTSMVMFLILRGGLLSKELEKMSNRPPLASARDHKEMMSVSIRSKAGNLKTLGQSYTDRKNTNAFTPFKQRVRKKACRAKTVRGHRKLSPIFQRLSETASIRLPVLFCL